MGLKYYIGKNNYAASHEGMFAFKYALVLKRLFEKYNYDGVLLVVPHLKGMPDSELPVDALLISHNAVIVVDFKSHGGEIITPDEPNYYTDKWYSVKPPEKIVIDGGSIHGNPFRQVKDYAKTLRRVLSDVVPDINDKYIHTGVVFYGNNVNLEKAIVPGKYLNTFFIADNNSKSDDWFYYKIQSVLGVKDYKKEKLLKLTDEQIRKIREKFVVVRELTDEEIEEFSNMSSKKIEELNQTIDTLVEEKKAADKRVEMLKKKIADLEKNPGFSDSVKTELKNMLGEIDKKQSVLSTELEQKWQREFDEIKKKLEKAKETPVNNVYFVPKTASRSKWPLVLGGLLLLVAAIGLIGYLIAISNNNQDTSATIERPGDLEGPYKAFVYNGDTVSFYINGEKKKVTLIGVDSPEAKSTYKDAECYGEQAKSYLIEKIGGKEVYLGADETQGDADRWGNLLRYIWLDDELINYSLLKEGYAKEYTYDNPYRYRENFLDAQADAYSNGRGLWTSCSGF